MQRPFILLAATFVVLPWSGCSAEAGYKTSISAADFVEGVTTPFFPLSPGSNWTYGSETEEIFVEVQHGTRDVNGIPAVVVRDTVREDGRVIEDTWDWYAQDKAGNVWYLGEDTSEFEDGRLVSKEGSWEWGRDGALPGIIMWAHPVANDTPYYQEYYKHEAVDQAAVVSVGDTATTAAGTFSDTVTTREWTKLERGVEEHAVYARGVGLVLKEVTQGDNVGSREELRSYSIE